MSGNQFFIICFIIAVIVILLFTFAEHLLVNKEAFGEELLVDWNDGESLEVNDSANRDINLSFEEFLNNILNYFSSTS